MEFKRTHRKFKELARDRKEEFEKNIKDFLSSSRGNQRERALNNLVKLNAHFLETLGKIEPKISEQDKKFHTLLHTFGTYSGLVKRGEMDLSDEMLKEHLPNLYGISEHHEDLQLHNEMKKKFRTHLDKVKQEWPGFVSSVEKEFPPSYEFLNQHGAHSEFKEVLEKLLNVINLRVKVEQDEELTDGEKAQLTPEEREHKGSNPLGATDRSYRTYLVAARNGPEPLKEFALEKIEDYYFPAFIEAMKTHIDSDLSSKQQHELLRSYSLDALTSLLKEGKMMATELELEEFVSRLFRPEKVPLRKK